MNSNSEKTQAGGDLITDLITDHLITDQKTKGGSAVSRRYGSPISAADTGVALMEDWISKATNETDRGSRIAYAKAWVKGQQRLGVLSADQAQRVLCRLTTEHTIKKRTDGAHPLAP